MFVKILLEGWHSGHKKMMDSRRINAWIASGSELSVQVHCQSRWHPREDNEGKAPISRLDVRDAAVCTYHLLSARFVTHSLLNPWNPQHHMLFSIPLPLWLLLLFSWGCPFPVSLNFDDPWVICPQLSWPTSFCSFSLGNPIYSQGFSYISMALGAPYPSTSQSSIRHYSSNSTLSSVKSFLTSSPCPHKSTPCPTYPVSEWYCHAPRISSQEMQYPWFSSAHYFSLTLCLQLTSLHTTSFFTLQQD